MYKYSWLLALVIFARCGGAPADPAAELEQLKAQKSEIEAKIAALEGQAGASGTAPASRRIRTVSVEPLKPGLFQHLIDVQGRVEAENSIMATTKMPGTLTAVSVKNGTYVQKGQTLATLDLSVMQKSLSEIETQLSLAKDLYSRQKSLWDQKVGTEMQYIQAKTQVEALEKSMATLREQMSMGTITAPISGTVDNVILKAGQSIAPGMPLCHIVNLGELKVVASVPETYGPFVRKGAAVKVFFPDLNREINSSVRYAAQTIDPISRTFAVEAALPGGKEYRPNMVAVNRIIDYQNNAAIVVPVNVIQTDETGPYVLVAEKTGEKSAKVAKKHITQGQSYNGNVEIKGGLASGDLLIKTGWQDVNPGEEVNL